MTTLVTKPRLSWLLVLALVAVVVAFGGDHQALAEAAHEEGHSGGLPQFDATFFLTQLFWLTAIFGTFYLLVQGVAVPKVVQVIETRDAKIGLDIKRAEEARNEASKVTSLIEDKIVHARDHARTILSLASREADNVATARLAMFDARIAGRVRDAERRISHARETAIRDLPEQAGALVQDIVTHLSDAKAKPTQLTAAVTQTLAERESH